MASSLAEADTRDLTVKTLPPESLPRESLTVRPLACAASSQGHPGRNLRSSIMVYLIHFDRPLHHARHYLGYCADGTMEVRLIRHRAGRGARILAALRRVDIGWRVVRVFDGDYRFERRLKSLHKIWHYCPVCSTSPWTPRGAKELLRAD
jgi:hypothetical protein